MGRPIKGDKLALLLARQQAKRPYLRPVEEISFRPPEPAWLPTREDLEKVRAPATAGTVPRVAHITPRTVPKVLKRGIGFRARSVQEAHTVWEQEIYEALWKAARPVDADTREISIGYRHIAKLANKGIKTVQRNMKSLAYKLAIQPVGRYDSDTKTPKTYLIYSYVSILRRRAEAGLEWAVRSRQGVTLGTVPMVTTVPTVGIATVPKVTTVDCPQGDHSFRDEEIQGKDCERCEGTGWEVAFGRRVKCGCGSG
jgi:hypothetical protein